MPLSSPASPTAAYVRFPASTVSMPDTPCSMPNAALPLCAEPAAERVPCGLTRIPCTPATHDVASAYVFRPRVSAATFCGPSRLSILVGSSFPPVAEPAGTRVPFSSMRTTWTPSLLPAATMAYALPPMVNAETPCAPPSTPKPPLPLTAEPAGTSTGRCAALISMSFEPPSESADPTAGSIGVAFIPPASTIVPPLSDSASVPA